MAGTYSSFSNVSSCTVEDCHGSYNPTSERHPWNNHGFNFNLQTTDRPPTAPLGKESFEDRSNLAKTTHLLDSRKSNLAFPQKPLWSPVWLRRKILIALLLLHVLLLVAFLFLWRYIIDNDGLPLSLSTNQYLWIYGPTAILTVAVSFGRQVDYNSKMIQPWIEMKKGEATALRSVLLNYLSPIQILSLIKAVRNRHYNVIVSITAFVLLKIVIVISTGLFVTLPSNTTVPVMVTLSSHFQDTGIFNTAGLIPDENPNVWRYQDVSNAPVFAYDSLLEGRPWHADTQLNLTYQTFVPADSTPYDGTLSAAVDIFMPYVICEQAKVTFLDGDLIALDSPSCSAGHPRNATSAMDILSPSYNMRNCETSTCPYTNFFRTARINCTDGSGIELNDTRMSFVMMNVSTATKVYSNGTLRNSSTDLTVQGYTAGICKFDYTVKKGNLSQSLNGLPNLDLSQSQTSSTTLPFLSPVQLMDLVRASMQSASTSYPDLPSGFKGFDEGATTLFAFMNKTSTIQASQQLYSNATALINSASQTYQGIANQVFRQFFVVERLENATGAYSSTHYRLYVRPASSWGVSVGLSLVIFSSLILIFTTTPAVVSQDPSFMLSQASILASSRGFQSLLSSEGHSRTSTLRKKLSSFKFTTTCTDVFSINVIDTGSQASNSDQKDLRPKKSWTPYSGQSHAIALTVLSPVVAILALEILYQKSESGAGFFEVKGDSPPIQQLLRYSTVLTAVLIATLYTSLDYAIATLSPLSGLRTESTASRSLLMKSSIGRYPPLAFVDALVKGYLGAALANVAGVVSSLLTIMAVGLWVLDTSVKVKIPGNAAVVDHWDLSWQHSLFNDNGAAARFSRMQLGAMYNLPNIWNDLVIPRISRGHIPDGTNISANSLNYTVDVPALRPLLDCQTVPLEAYKVWRTSIYNEFWNANITVPLPAGCSKRSSPNGSYTFGPFALTLSNGRFDDMTEMYDVRDGTIVYDMDKSLDLVDEYPRGCPSLLFHMGSIDQNHSRLANVSSVICTQRLQEVYTTVSYTGSSTDLLVRTDTPPVPNELTAKYLRNGTTGLEAFIYEISLTLKQYLTSSDYRTTSVGLLLNQLVNGLNGTAAADLQEPENIQTFSKAVSRFYQSYMVQVIDLNFRSLSPVTTAVDTGLSHSLINSTATYHVQRMKVDYKSKFILQIMLGVMAVCAISAYLEVDLRNTSPRDPHTIAATMAFFADSSVIKRPYMPVGEEWLSANELRKIYGRQGFSLGWWEEAKDCRPDDDLKTERRRVRVHDLGFGSGFTGNSTALETGRVPSGKKHFGIDVGVPLERGYTSGRGISFSTLKRRWMVGKKVG